MNQQIPHPNPIPSQPGALHNAPNASACKPFTAWPELMTCEDIVACCGLSQKRAYQLLKRKDLQRPFPKDRRNLVVSKFALRYFLSGRAITDDDLKGL